MSDRHFDYDCVLVGGGLTNSLLAYWIKKRLPHKKILIIERGKKLGGNHTWSFHQTDIAKKNWEWVEPFISKKWEGYSVAFPKYRRSFKTPYYSIRSSQLHDTVTQCVPVELETEVIGVAPHNVTGKEGQQWSARCVIDGRGLDGVNPEMVGYQKFLGLEIELEEPHALRDPILMDASCPQIAGFRFFYCLPFSERTILIEDTRYETGPKMSLPDYRAEIEAYCRQKGWKLKRVLNEEVGCLPIPLRARYLMGNRKFPDAWIQRLVPSVGFCGGFFHATTGYSIPYAVSMISDLLATPLNHDSVFPKLIKMGRANAWRQVFFRLLNRLLFFGNRPQERYRMLEFFYRLPAGLIHRFYSTRLWPTDYFRFFIGRPPVKIKDALKCVLHNRERMSGHA